MLIFKNNVFLFIFQSVEKLFIKVVELEPKITTLGDSLEESVRLQKDHEETLRNIQVTLFLYI